MRIIILKSGGKWPDDGKIKQLVSQKYPSGTMKDPLILIVTFIVYLSLCSGRFVHPDEYDRDYLVNQFRRHYQDKWQKIFHSREGNYRAVSHAEDGSSDYQNNNPRFYAYRNRPNSWESNPGAPDPAAVSSSENNENHAPLIPNDRLAIDEQEIDNLQGNENQIVQPQRDAAEKFKVATRAQARQLDSSNLNKNFLTDVKQQKAYADPDVATSGVYFIALVAGCSAAAVFGVMAAGFCWYKFQKNAKAAAEAEYPAYGVTGPNKEHNISPSGGGDRKLAQSAQMYHYQHQKQQMIAMEKTNGERQVSTSDLDSEEENEEGDYTVYECPGLAPTGEMEVKNPLFQDEPTPASPSVAIKPSNGET